jgi:sigma-E factor negative regulatory protein RseC
MATEQGIVVRLEGGAAWVRTTPTSACEGCSAKGSCNAVADEKEVRALNPTGAKVGDRIVLRLDSGPLLRAAFLMYVFPVLCLLLGAFAGQWLFLSIGAGPSAGAALLGCAAFAAAFGVVRVRGSRLARKPEYQPRITRVLGPG